MSDINSKEEWIRLPRPKERCTVTGLSRTSLAEILDEKNPATGEPYVMQYRKERHGKQSRTRLINRESLLEYFKSRSKAQNTIRFASKVGNPDRNPIGGNSPILASFMEHDRSCHTACVKLLS